MSLRLPGGRIRALGCRAIRRGAHFVAIHMARLPPSGRMTSSAGVLQQHRDLCLGLTNRASASARPRPAHRRHAVVQAVAQEPRQERLRAVPGRPLAIIETSARLCQFRCCPVNWMVLAFRQDSGVLKRKSPSSRRFDAGERNFSEFLRGDARTSKTLIAQLMAVAITTFTRRRPLAAITGHGRFPAPQYRMAFAHHSLPGRRCAKARPHLGPGHRNLSHGLPPNGLARRWPDAVTNGATGVSMRRWPGGCITQARTLYVDEELGLDLTNQESTPGLDDHSVPVGLSVGALPHHFQGGGEDDSFTCGVTFRILITSTRMASASFMPSICSRKPEPSTIVDRGSRSLRCVAPGRLFVTLAVEDRCARLFGAARPASVATRGPWTASAP